MMETFFESEWDKLQCDYKFNDQIFATLNVLLIIDWLHQNVVIWWYDVMNSEEYLIQKKIVKSVNDVILSDSFCSDPRITYEIDRL